MATSHFGHLNTLTYPFLGIQIFQKGGALTEKYQDVEDSFVTLSMAAAVTTSLKIATGICLVVQRDPIQTVKLVASLDQISAGRFLFGVGLDGILRK